ncbi:hypothetical protein L2E82_32003 [Cichorium intybus]|uniref:Uncharacterized protein n=1 Tax=Cichorium intybus TaxID=13427 RepID=A0ACB9BG11_CICIN|nr:hypothetical protein L2E82_32003 [Cichorium intybus]
MNVVPNESTIKTDRIEVDTETIDLLASLVVAVDTVVELKGVLRYLLVRTVVVGGSIAAVGAGRGGRLVCIPTARVMKETRDINGDDCRVYDASQRRMRRWPTVVRCSGLMKIVTAHKRWGSEAALQLQIDGVDEDDRAAFAAEREMGYLI